MKLDIKEPMHIHSLGGEMAEATIVEQVGNNQYIAEYNGVKCTANYNPFAGAYYVDDKYGVIKGPPPRDNREHTR